MVASKRELWNRVNCILPDFVDCKFVSEILEELFEDSHFSAVFFEYPALKILVNKNWSDPGIIFAGNFDNNFIDTTKVFLAIESINSSTLLRYKNGLAQITYPIIVDEVLVGGLTSGLFFIEQPDLKVFEQFAIKHSLEVDNYIEQIKKIPFIKSNCIGRGRSALNAAAITIRKNILSNLSIRYRESKLLAEIQEKESINEYLQKSEEKYRELIEATNTGYAILNEKGELLEANAYYYKLLGYDSFEEIRGKKVFDWTADYDVARDKSGFKECLKVGVANQSEIDVITKNGKTITIEIAASVLPNSTVVGLVKDITDRRLEEAKRIEMEKQILQTQKLQSLGLMAGGIAHDFNNLLTGVIGNADLVLQSHDVSEFAKDCINKVILAGRRSAELCRQLLAYSGKGSFARQKIDLRKMVREMGAMLKVSISKKIITKYFYDMDLPAIEIDPSQMQQVVMNLIINASEAIGDKAGTISIYLSCKDCNEAYLNEGFFSNKALPGKYVVLEVNDSGCGIAQDKLKKIFEPFYTTKKTGRGLGLAAVMGIAKNNNGTVKIYSEEGHGTSIRVLLPAAQGDFDQIEEEQVNVKDWRGFGKALIADDTEIARLIGKNLLEFLGFKAILANNGQEAIDMFKQAEDSDENISLVMLDVSMPKKSGIEVFKEIRDIRPNTPIILSSGYDEQEIVVKLGRENCVAFVPKPYDLNVLVNKLKPLFEH